MKRPERTGRLWLIPCALLLASCGPKKPDADDWRRGPQAHGVIVEAPLPRAPGNGPPGTVVGRPVYSITQQAVFFPIAAGLKRHVYRYDIPAREGRWQSNMPDGSTALRPAFENGQLLGSSSFLRRRDRSPASTAQPFGAMVIRLEQHEQGYSRRYFNLGIPFGEPGWVTRQYGDGSLRLYAGADPADRTLLLEQAYRADNYPFIAGWSPDGRYALVVEEFESATYYRGLKGRGPALRFAVFGPYEVEDTASEIVAFYARADQRNRQRALDRKLRQGQIAPEERYGAFYEALIETIRSCPALLQVTGPIETLTLKPGRTLALTDGRDGEAGLYFTFEIKAQRGTGILQAAGFYTETPESVRREIAGRIVRYDLAFAGKNHYFDACNAH